MVRSIRFSALCLRVSFAWIPVLLCLFFFGTESSLAEDRREDSAIVVYNIHAKDAAEIASYYVNSRSLSSAQLCPVAAPPGLIGTAAQLLGIRRTIIEQCICPLIPVNRRPVPCSADQTEAISQVSSISHMVIIRGMPSRLTGTGWSSDNEEPSFDYYLAGSLYKPVEAYFHSGATGSATQLPNYKATWPENPQSILMRPVDPAKDRTVVYGRVEALTKESTLSLIDRTLEAEGNGFQGNAFTAGAYSGLGNFLRDFFRDPVPACTDYIEADSTWPHATCRTGQTVDGKVPGHGPTIPRPMNAGIYLGGNPFPNNHSAFNGRFSVMKSWHKSQYDCPELCSDLPTLQQVTQCRQNSTDFFKELNTACVGVADGFVGHQVRSYPVQYYGVFPPGFTTYGSGHLEKTAPRRVHSADAFHNTAFQDDYYIRFGGNATSVSLTCPDKDGIDLNCNETIPISLVHTHPQNLTLRGTSNTVSVLMRVRYRYSGTPDASFALQTVFRAEGLAWMSAPFTSISLDSVPQNTWVTAEHRASVDASALRDGQNKLTRIDFSIQSNLARNLNGTFDVDGFEIFDEGTGDRLLDLEKGSFSAPYINNLAPGDYAANMIDRMGGIAWWGSSSHHLTGGWAFANTSGFSGAFLSGRTLGESVHLAGSGMSGIIYGDPLYSPGAVKLYLEGEPASIYDPEISTANDPTVYRILGYDPSTYQRRLLVRALQGRSRISQTRWSVERCIQNTPDPVNCSSWNTIESGGSATLDTPVQLNDLRDLATDLSRSQYIFLRLKVWHSGVESSARYNVAHFLYEPVPEISNLLQRVSVRGTQWPRNFMVNVAYGDKAPPFTIVPEGRVNQLRLNARRAEVFDDFSIAISGAVQGELSIVSQSYSDDGKEVLIEFSPEVDSPEQLVVFLSAHGKRFPIRFNVLPGDFSLEGNYGEIDSLDVDILRTGLQLQDGGIVFPPEIIFRLDVNRDGVFNAADVTALENSISSGPITLPPVNSACTDGVDNDEDSLVDLDDPGCTSLTDDNEREQGPREPPGNPQLVVHIPRTAGCPDMANLQILDLSPDVVAIEAGMFLVTAAGPAGTALERVFFQLCTAGGSCMTREAPDADGVARFPALNEPAMLTVHSPGYAVATVQLPATGSRSILVPLAEAETYLVNLPLSQAVTLEDRCSGDTSGGSASITLPLGTTFENFSGGMVQVSIAGYSPQTGAMPGNYGAGNNWITSVGALQASFHESSGFAPAGRSGGSHGLRPTAPIDVVLANTSDLDRNRNAAFRRWSYSTGTGQWIAPGDTRAVTISPTGVELTITPEASSGIPGLVVTNAGRSHSNKSNCIVFEKREGEASPALQGELIVEQPFSNGTLSDRFEYFVVGSEDPTVGVNQSAQFFANLPRNRTAYIRLHPSDGSVSLQSGGADLGTSTEVPNTYELPLGGGWGGVNLPGSTPESSCIQIEVHQAPGTPPGPPPGSSALAAIMADLVVIQSGLLALPVEPDSIPQIVTYREELNANRDKILALGHSRMYRKAARLVKGSGKKTKGVQKKLNKLSRKSITERREKRIKKQSTRRLSIVGRRIDKAIVALGKVEK